jgi:hypothetical protein
LLCVLIFAASAARGQPTRTRDVGFAVVRFDQPGERALGAITLNEALFAQTTRSLSYANALVSFFDDARWSVQGTLAGARYSEPVRAPTVLNRYFGQYQGDFTLSAATTAQDGFMPTLHVVSEGGITLTGSQRAVRSSVGIARTFDGARWRTTVMSTTRFWMERGRSRYAVSATPVQLQGGDILGDFEGNMSFSVGRSLYEVTGGLRTGEGIVGRSTWGGVTASWPLSGNVFLSASVGRYPVDLLQTLPGGRYAALSLRVPPSGFRIGGRPVPRVPVLPPAPRTPRVPTTEQLAIAVGEPYDSLHLREVRVWAPGNPRVELLADFTDWIPVPLVRQPNGEWQGFYRVPPGARRVNLRLNGHEVVVPLNLSVLDDEFTGRVGVLIVR